MKYYKKEDFEGIYPVIPKGENFEDLAREVIKEYDDYPENMIWPMAQEIVELRTMAYQEGAVWESMFSLRPQPEKDYSVRAPGLFMASGSRLPKK